MPTEKAKRPRCEGASLTFYGADAGRYSPLGLEGTTIVGTLWSPSAP